VRLALLGVLLVVLTVAAVLIGVPDARTVRAEVAALGPVAPPAFVLLYAGTCLLPLPRTVLSVASGLLFGLSGGLLLALVGAVLGATAGFALSRVLGRDAVERLTGTRVARVDALLARRGLAAVLFVRLVPVIPFTPVNYAAGLSAVRLRDFVLGTAVGSVPGTAASVALGAYGTAPGSWPFLAAVASLLVLSAGGAWVAARRRRTE